VVPGVHTLHHLISWLDELEACDLAFFTHRSSKDSAEGASKKLTYCLRNGMDVGMGVGWGRRGRGGVGERG
jgi:hypothetical protein